MKLIKVGILIFFSFFTFSCGADPKFEKPYIMIVGKIEAADIESCRNDENCMDLLELDNLNPAVWPCEKYRPSPLINKIHEWNKYGY